jgi:hypothetical protein
VPLGPAHQAIAVSVHLDEALDRSCLPEISAAATRLGGGRKGCQEAKDQEENGADLEGLVHLRLQVMSIGAAVLADTK